MINEIISIFAYALPISFILLLTNAEIKNIIKER
jgi:hypothetical protein